MKQFLDFKIIAQLIKKKTTQKTDYDHRNMGT